MDDIITALTARTGTPLSEPDRQHRVYNYSEPEFPGRHVVVWSGGYDSTLVLAEVARRYSATNAVIAVVVQSTHLDDRQAKLEQRAREAFLKHAAACGWNIRVATVRLEATALAVDWTVHSLLAQATLWFHAVVPYLRSNDKVYWGYIRRDEYWLVRDRMVRALSACMEASFISGVTFEYPLACAEKRDVVDALARIGVPTELLWTCDAPDGSNEDVPCGMCGKCKALAEARECPTVVPAQAVRAVFEKVVSGQTNHKPDFRARKLSRKKTLRKL